MPWGYRQVPSNACVLVGLWKQGRGLHGEPGHRRGEVGRAGLGSRVSPRGCAGQPSSSPFCVRSLRGCKECEELPCPSCPPSPLPGPGLGEGLAGVLPPAGLGTPLSPGFPPAQEALGPATGWQLRLTRVTCSFFSFFFFFPYIFL